MISTKCRQQDGGTRVVPGFHRCFMQWLEALGLRAIVKPDLGVETSGKTMKTTYEKLQTKFDLLKIWGDWGAGEATWKAIWHKVANMTIGCYEELPAVAVSNFPTSILSTSCRGWASGPNGSTRSITRIIRGRQIFSVDSPQLFKDENNQSTRW